MTSSALAALVSPDTLDALAFLELPATQMFNDRQRAAIAEVELGLATDPVAVAWPRSLYLILKATRLCNLRCTYCSAWREGPDQVMAFRTLANVIAQGMRLPGISTLHIVWHGGETTLLSQRYFERAIWLQEHFRIDRRRVDHAIQTNATRVDDDWARFFKAAGFSVGVSLDVDRANHDRQRVFKGGGGSYAATLAGVEALRRHGVPHGMLAVIDEACLAAGARVLLERLVASGIPAAGLLNALPANDGVATPTAYLPWERYVAFLRELYAIWHADYRTAIDIRELGALHRIVAGEAGRLCLYQGGCMGQYLTIDPDGTVSACDKYVGDADYQFGNLNEAPLHALLTNSAGLSHARAETRALLDGFADCPNHHICRGGCPHDARLNARHGGDGTCCGLHPLIEDMKGVVAKERNDGPDHDGSRRVREAEGR